MSWLFGKKKKIEDDLVEAVSSEVEFVDDDYKPQTASVKKESGSDLLLDEELSAKMKSLGKFNFKFYHLVKPGMKLVNIDKKNNGNMYEVYFAPDYQTAVKFLRNVPRQDIPGLYYVIVETPEGNVGKDIDGIFDERTGNSID